MIKFAGLISCAIAVCGLSACSPTDGLIGPCSASNRVGSNESYEDLALSLVTKAAWKYSNGEIISDKIDRDRRLKGIEKVREEWLPTIADPCLRSHANKWLDVKVNLTKDYVIGKGDYFDQKEAEKRDQRRALADKLGVPIR